MLPLITRYIPTINYTLYPLLFVMVRCHLLLYVYIDHRLPEWHTQTNK